MSAPLFGPANTGGGGPGPAARAVAGPWLRVVVYGDPVPQGSKRPMLSKATGRPIVVEGNRSRLLPWRQQIARTVAAELERLGRPEPLLGPVRLRLDFRVPHRSSYGRRPKLKHAARQPDIDKLMRAVCDALTRVVYRNDGQVTHVTARKRVAQPGTASGVEITVELDADDDHGAPW